ncbi:MAG TPA: TonB-dependent receptor, partial [Gemmatimonadales bacterium]|nr:TonB-dependent receptor [Gemmatimonadales bacterium]
RSIDVTADTPFTVDAVLDAQPIELGSVLVEGVSRAPDRMMDAPAAVEVVRAATAEHVSITGQAPLALARVPGLDVTQENVTDFDVNARGFNTTLNRKLLVLQDGRDLAAGITGSVIWGAVSEPLEDLGRIEVIRGPGSALYGPNAFNGVVNITTPEARDVVGTKLTLGGGELGTVRADLRHAGVWLNDRLGYRVNLGYTKSDDWTRSRTAKDGSDWKEEYAPATTTPPSLKPDSLPMFGQIKDSATGRALGTPDPTVAVSGSARVDYYAANGGVMTFEGGTARLDNSVFLGGAARNEVPRILHPWARVAWNTAGSSSSAWYSGTSSSFVGLASGTTSYLDESLFHVESRTSRSFPGDAGRLVVGASVQDNMIDTRGTVLSPANDGRSDLYYGAFAQLEYAVGHLRVIGAVRWDDSELFPAQLSPKSALVFSPARNHALHLSVDRAFLTPRLANLFAQREAAVAGGVQNLMAIEDALRADPSVGPALASVPRGALFDRSAAVPDSAFGNAHLVPQTVTNYEVGYKGQIGRRLFITLDAYDARIDNFLTGQLPAGSTGLNPAYQPWTAPPQVPASSRALVASAVFDSLLGAPCGPVCAYGLTRLADGTSAIVLSFGNVGRVDEWGVELGGSVSLTTALTASVSYTWYNFAVRQNVVSNVLAPNTPHSKGTVAFEYTGRQGLDFGVGARIVGGFWWSNGNFVGYVPSSQTVDLNAAYRISVHLRGFVNATDLFNERRFQVYGGAVIGRRVLGGVTSTF